MDMSGRLARQSHSVGVRRALFQIQLWTGVGIGYAVLMSLSGSLIVFRRELDKALCPRTIIVPPSGPRMTDAQLQAKARAAFPRLDFNKVEVRGSRIPGAASEVWLTFTIT